MQKPELLSNDAGQSPARMIDEMSRLYYLSRAIHVAAELGIADRLADEPMTVTSLAETSGTDAGALRRLLRFLSAYQIFEACSPDSFRNTDLSSVLRDDHPQSVRANLRRIGTFWWNAIGELEHSIRTGESAFGHVHGVPFFQYLKSHEDIQKRFDEAMARISDSDDAAIASAYDFARFKRIVDVGGGRGGLLVQILKRTRDAVGVLFEQPQVIDVATRLDEAGLLNRSEKIGGDFFEAVPGGGDCYVIKGVLHDFDDNQCVTILSNCRKAMRDGGCVVIANQDLPPSIDAPHPNLTMDIQMMTLLHGRERSVHDWSTLFQQSGLKLGGAIETDIGFTVVEGMPK
ncbi:MAG: methyltransferase [Alphaproteobacteria bacterium]|jgi:C-methyltransferase